MHALRGVACGWHRADACGYRTDFRAHGRPGPNPIDAVGRACASKAQEQGTDHHCCGMCRCGPHRGRHGVCAYGTQRVKERRHADFGDRYRGYGSGDSDDYLTDVHTYTNDMHPYSMSIPNRFEMVDTPSGSGTRYEDPETGFVINLFGFVNINDETAHEMFIEKDTSGKTDLYTAEGDNWCVVSWREGDTIIYEKTIVTDSTVATAHLEYSTANRDMGSKIIDTLLPTFQVD